MTISTNSKPTIYRNMCKNTGQAIYSHFHSRQDVNSYRNSHLNVNKIQEYNISNKRPFVNSIAKNQL